MISFGQASDSCFVIDKPKIHILSINMTTQKSSLFWQALDKLLTVSLALTMQNYLFWASSIWQPKTRHCFDKFWTSFWQLPCHWQTKTTCFGHCQYDKPKLVIVLTSFGQASDSCLVNDKPKLTVLGIVNLTTQNLSFWQPFDKYLTTWIFLCTENFWHWGLGH